jgi:uncharacterized protein YdaU (DUF1376 family)
MAKRHIPYFSFYPADFMNGMRGLNPQEVGILIMLLCRIYEENGPIEYHVSRLATYCGTRDAAFVKIVERLIDLGKFNLSEDRLSNIRAGAEIQKREACLERASRAGKASAQKNQQKQQQEPTAVQQSFNQTDTDTDTEKTEERKEPPAPIKFTEADIRRELEAWASPAAVSSFISYRRKSKGKALTITASKRLATHLKAIFDAGGDVDDALGMAEERGWQTIEPDWYLKAKGNENGQRIGGGAGPGPHNAFLAGFAMAANPKPR